MTRATGRPGVPGRGGLREASPGRHRLWWSGRVAARLWGHTCTRRRSWCSLGTSPPRHRFSPYQPPLELLEAGRREDLTSHRFPVRPGEVSGLQVAGGRERSRVRRWVGCSAAPFTSPSPVFLGSGSSLSPATHPAGTRSAPREGWPLLPWVRLHQVSKAASGCRSLQDTRAGRDNRL